MTERKQEVRTTGEGGGGRKGGKGRGSTEGEGGVQRGEGTEEGGRRRKGQTFQWKFHRYKYTIRKCAVVWGYLNMP